MNGIDHRATLKNITTDREQRNEQCIFLMLEKKNHLKNKRYESCQNEMWVDKSKVKSLEHNFTQVEVKCSNLNSLHRLKSEKTLLDYLRVKDWFMFYYTEI